MITGTDTGFTEMRMAKVAGFGPPAAEEFSYCVVLDEVSGDRHLVIQIGDAEGFSLAASLGGTRWGRPMTYQFAAGLVRGLGGRVFRVHDVPAARQALAAVALLRAGGIPERG